MHGVGPAAGLVLHILYRLQWLAALADTILHTPHHPLSFPADSFTLVWESKVLLQLNNAPGRLLTTQAAGQGLQLATHSFLYAGAGLVAALGPTVLLGTASGLIISNAWAVASERAVKAGKQEQNILPKIACHDGRRAASDAPPPGARHACRLAVSLSPASLHALSCPDLQARCWRTCC